MRSRLALSFGIFILIGLPGIAAAQLVGDEVYFQRVSENTSGPFLRLFQDEVLTVGAGVEYDDGVHQVDVGQTSIRITDIYDSAYAELNPHEIRFFVPARILGFTLTNSNFGTLSTGDITFSMHILTIDVSGLDTDLGGFAHIELQLAQQQSQSVPALTGWGLGLLMTAIATGALIILRRNV